MDLYKELEAAALAVTATDFAHLKRLGVMNQGVAHMGLFHHQLGVMTIAEGEEGLFYPDPDGKRALVVPVYEDWQLLDLVAFSTSNADDWLLRTGLGTALGLFDGWHHYWPEVVKLHQSPLQWLQAGGEGLCVVDWSAPDIHRLNDLPSISVGSEALRQRLRNALLRPVRLLPITLDTETRLAA
jgi:hypothetical protein